MLKFSLLIGLLFHFTNAHSQSILLNQSKYQVKIVSSPLTYMAVIPLKNGDRETYKNVELSIIAEKIKKEDLDKLLDLSIYEPLNYKARDKCKNKYSWRPTKIEISKSDIEDIIITTIIGSSVNAFDTRDELIFKFEYLDGLFFNL